MKTHITPKYLTIAEAALHCSLSEKTIRRLIGRGELPHYRPCRSVLIALSDLEAYLDSVRVESVNLDMLAVR